MGLICTNLSMTCCSTTECTETALGFVTQGWNAVSDHTLISIIFMLVEALEMLCDDSTDALAPQAEDLKPDNLENPLRIMCIFKKLNLS